MRRFRILVVIYDFSRENMALIAGASFRDAGVARELSGLYEQRGSLTRLSQIQWGSGLISTIVLKQRCRDNG